MPLDAAHVGATGELLKDFIRRSGKTQRKLADEINADPTYISQMTRGKVNWINSQYFAAIVSALGIRPDEVRELKPESVINFQAVKPATETGGHLEQLGYTMKNVYDLVQASRPRTEMEPIPDISPVPVPNRDLRPGAELFRVRGDSMTVGGQGGILEGDVIYVDTRDLTPQPGRVYVLHIPGDGVCLKRVQVLGDALYLFSDHEDQSLYPPFRADDARVIGRVYHVTRTPRVRL